MRPTCVTYLSLWLVASAGPLAGQVVRGTVVEAETAMLLSGAEIVLLDRSGEARVRDFSDDRGDFVLRAPGAGAYRLLVRHLGHATYTSDVVEVARNADVRVEVRMGVDAIPLEPFLVVGRRTPEAAHLRDFEERRLSPAGSDGHFLTREDIERRPMATPTQLLRQLPGVTVQQVLLGATPNGLDRSLVLMAGGRCLANVYVDGVRTSQSPTHTVDDLLDGAQIAGIEVYPRAGAAPIQYQADPGCGVVLYWTGRPSDDGAGWGLKRILVGVGAVVGVVFLGVTLVG